MRSTSNLLLMVFIMNLSYGSMVIAIQTPQDLTNSYKDAKSQIGSLQSKMVQLPQSTQNNLNGSLKSASNQIDIVYQNTLGAIEPLEKKTDLYSYEQLNNDITNAQQNINQIVYTISLKINSALSAYEQQQADQNAKNINQETAKLIKAKMAYQEQMVKFFNQVEKLLPSYDTTFDNVQQFQKNMLFLHRPYDVKKIEDLTAQIDFVAQKAYQIYKQLGPIKADDRSSLLVLTLRSLSNFYMDLITYILQELNNQKKDDDYYRGLSDLSIKIMGTNNPSDSGLIRNGYDGTFKNIVSKYFSDTSEQTKMLDYYLQKKIDSTYLLYANALQTLSLQLSNPTALQMKNASDIYALLMSEIAVLPKTAATVGVARVAHENMALLNIASAQSLIKTMQVSQDTASIVARITDFYKQASLFFSKAVELIVDFYKQDEQSSKTFSNADRANAQLYTNLYNSLTQASSNLKQAQAAQKSGDESTAIQLYKKAQSLFTQGGDGIDVDKIGILLSDLEGQFAIKKVQNSFNTLISQNKSLIQEYLKYIGSLDKSSTMSSFSNFFSALVELYQKSYVDLSTALQSYQSVSKNNPSLKQSNDIVQTIQNLTSSVSLLSTLSQAQTALQSGDQILDSLTANALQDAEKYYANAISLYQTADDLYSANNQLNKYVPQYFLEASNQNLDFTSIANQHIAKLDIELADSLQGDLITALLYYNDANNRFKYLTESVDNFITTTLSSLSKEKNAIAALFSDAQNSEKALVALPSDAWIPKPNASGYSSDATVKWNGLLQQYLTVYRLGYKEAKDAFINAVTSYAEAYKKYVPESYYPDFEIAMIKYQQYVMNANENDDNSLLVKEIEPLVSAFFDKAQKLIDSIANPSALIVTATTDQLKIIEWSKFLDRALDQQEKVLDSVGQSLDNQQIQQVLLFKKNIDQEGNITYTFFPTKKIVVLQNPVIKLGSLYKQLGDYYFNQKDPNYSLAYSSYYYAKQTFLQANRSDLVTPFEEQLALSDTLYLASEYRDLITPKGQATIASFKVPENYELTVYGQNVPSVIANSLGDVSLLIKNPQKEQEALIALASQLYFYYKISDTFGADQFEKISGIIANKNYAALPSDQQAALIVILENAEQFQKEIKNRVTKGISNLLLQQTSKQTYALYEYYIPVPRFSDVKKYYQGYPAAINYYLWAAYLFKPGPQGETITVGSETLPHGNDQDQYLKMVNNQIDLYLSQGYSFQSQVDGIKTGTRWDALKKSNKNNMSLSINDYMPVYLMIKNLYNEMIAYYNGPLANNLVDEKSNLNGSINSLIGSSYKELGDTLSSFLIGDPLSHNYTSVLKDILGNYINSIVTYNYTTNLYSSMAQFYNNAGQILVDQQKYFDSISFFYTAATLLQRITTPTPEIQKLIAQSYLNYFGGMFKGATYNIGNFQKAQTGLITITLTDGTVEKISFNDLLEKYLSFLTQSGGSSTTGLDQAELDESQKLKDLILDALVFYNGCNSQAQPVINALIPDKNSLSKVNEEALSLIHSFSSKNTISFDSLSSVTLMMQRTDFPDGKDFVTMLNSGFDQFKTKVEQSSDSFNKAIGYSAIAQFALKLYSAFSYLYMDIYLGGVSVDAETNLTAAIKAEINQILSPSNQYIG